LDQTLSAVARRKRKCKCRAEATVINETGLAAFGIQQIACPDLISDPV